MPPTLVIHDRADPIVPFVGVQHFLDALERNEVIHQSLLGDGIGHGFYIVRDNFSSIAISWDLYPNVVIEFLMRHLDLNAR